MSGGAMPPAHPVLPGAEDRARVLGAAGRLETLRRTGLLDGPGEAAFDRLSACAVRLLRVPAALVTLVSDDRQCFTGCVGLPEPWMSARETPLSHSFCQHVVATGGPLVIRDAREHPQLRASPAIADLRVVGYLGVPLLAPDGSVLGSFCAIDRDPRAWTDEEVRGVQDLARWAAAEVELRLERAELVRVAGEREALAAELRASAAALEGTVARRTAELEHTVERLRRSEADARHLFERAGDGILLVDPAHGTVLRANPAACALFGVPRARLEGGPAPLPLAGAPGAAGPVRVHAVHARPDGAPVHLEASLAPVEHDGRPALLCGCRDVTARVRAEAALREEERRFQDVVERMAEALIITDLESRIVYANPRVEEIFGWRPGELLGHVSGEVLVAPEERDGMMARLERRKGGDHERYQVRSLRRDGSRGWIEVAAAPFRDADGNVVGTLGAVTDVTEPRRVREELEQSLSLLRATLDATTDGILVVDLEGRVRGWNPRFAEMWDVVPPGDGEADDPLLHSVAERAADPAGFVARVRELYRHADAVSHDEVVLADGRVFERTSRPQRVGDRIVGRVWSFHDATRHRRAEAGLQAQRAYLAAVLDALPSAVWVKDWDGRFVLGNRALADLYDTTPAALIGCTDGDFNPDAEQVRGFLEGDREVIRSRRMLSVEEPITLPVSGETRWFSTRKVALFPPDGGRLQVLGVATDITDRREAERALRESQRQLLHSQKMEAVGRLAGGIAHDFNNMLMAIGGHAELLRTADGVPDDARWHAAEIRKAADRAAGLTRQLLAFSRKQVLQPRALSINAVVTDVESMLRRLIGEDVRLRTSLSASVGVVRADPGQLEQVLMNLAVNARDAMPEGGTLTIETSSVMLEGRVAEDGDEVAAGPYVMLAVRDTGVGMDEGVRQRVFEPFFTTKPQGKGTGLGLSTAYGIIRQSGGHVRVESEAGAGTTFRIYLPVERSPQAAPERVADTGPAPGGSETVLLVEDDEVVRGLLAMFLRRLGYDVVAADGGAQALSLAEAAGAPPQLLLTDVVMPGMSGRELAGAVRARWPEVRVIYMSGYTSEAIDRHGVLEPGAEFIQKPVAPDTLARRLRDVLGPPPAE
ncbi:PAS domain S-box protein [Longimicrobium sp.]|uniref:PAS domain S-box protein n=1 Tax=Longimicrobium sp. TaxID=2029185 RepID=UPI002E36E05C|nr:PAS domain S-box protein [Longimicrobium sp.]HEX6039833.1 PAS domain S-box protein [Longimicrobium sp.]